MYFIVWAGHVVQSTTPTHTLISSNYIYLTFTRPVMERSTYNHTDILFL